MDAQSSYGYATQLATLNDDGAVPETRLKLAMDANALLTQRIYADRTRAGKRALVKGLVDGNPPYRSGDMKAAGTADRCNVNWRIAESYLNQALGAFYDIFEEADTYCKVKTRAGNPQETQEWSEIITEEFDLLQRADKSFDYNMQISQYEMVLYGDGPFVFSDAWDWRPRAAHCQDLLVPEWAKSNTEYWEEAWIRSTYLPSELYSYILDEKTATDIGWNVEAVKKAIIRAHPKSMQGGQYLSWEWHQQNLKNGSLWYSAQSRTISVGHVYFREFPKENEVEGRISHKIVLENNGAEDTEHFLFERVGRFERWQQCIHPMYYDHGGGGYHHSVTGMGIKFYSAMEYQNRLICRLADDAFMPKIMFKPTTASDRKKLSIAHFGQYAVIPSGLEFQQMPITSLMQDGMLFNREMTGQIAANLSQYRQNLENPNGKGNPATATQIVHDASEQSRLGKTQLNRYFAQLDDLYEEKYIRAINPNLTELNPGGKAALEFQQRCKERGVPTVALHKYESVRASRIVGQGSSFLRQQSLEFLLGMISMLPEDGRQNLINDTIASRTGQSFTARYNPKTPQNTLPSDQESEAQDKIVGMKVGMPAIVTSSQNPIIFASAYLKAASDAATSLQQGGDVHSVLAFIQLVGAGVHAQLQRISSDPTRKGIFNALTEQWKKLAQFSDKLSAQVQRQMQQQQKDQAQAAKARESVSLNYSDLPEDVKRQAEAAAGFQPSRMNGNGKDHAAIQSKLAKAQADIAAKAAKTQSDIANKRASTGADILAKRQQMQISDVQSAHKIRLDAAAAKSKSKEKSGSE